MHFAIEMENLRSECATLRLASRKVLQKEGCSLRGFRWSRDIAQWCAFKNDWNARTIGRYAFRGDSHKRLTLRVDDPHA